MTVSIEWQGPLAAEAAMRGAAERARRRAAHNRTPIALFEDDRIGRIKVNGNTSP